MQSEYVDGERVLSFRTGYPGTITGRREGFGPNGDQTLYIITRSNGTSEMALATNLKPLPELEVPSEPVDLWLKRIGVVQP